MKFTHLGAVLASVALLSVSSASLAHDHEGDHEGEHEDIVHYEVAEPQSNQAALELLQGKTEAIGAVMANATLDGNDLEKIHEHTYSLEAAVDKLRQAEQNPARESALDAADEAVQALHYASENHEADISREWYARLSPSVDMVEAAFTADATPTAIEQ